MKHQRAILSHRMIITLTLLLNTAILLTRLAIPNPASAGISPSQLQQIQLNSTPLAADVQLQLLKIMQAEPSLARLLDAVQQTLNVATKEKIFDFVAICPALEKPTTTRKDNKQTAGNCIKSYASELLVQAPYFVKPEPRLPAVGKTFDLAPIDLVTHLLLTHANYAICLKPGLTLNETLGFLTHEFTHLAGGKGQVSPIDGVLKYSDQADYVQQILFSSGGEFEAYSAEARVIRKFFSKNEAEKMNELLQFFSSTGEVIQKESLAHYILENLAYRTVFTQRYLELVASNRKNTLLILRDQTEKIKPKLANSLQLLKTNRARLEQFFEQIRGGAKAPASTVAEAQQRLSENQAKTGELEIYLKNLDSLIETNQKNLERLRQRTDPGRP